MRAYFASGPARAARLLLIDNLDAADAQAELCAFALGVANVSSHPRCRALLSKPMQRTLPPETSGKPPWSLRYNAPLGPAWEIPAWRGCVRRANHSGLMHKTPRDVRVGRRGFERAAGARDLLALLSLYFNP